MRGRYPLSNRVVAVRVAGGMVVGWAVGVLVAHAFGRPWTGAALTLLPVMIVVGLVLYFGARH